MPSRPSRQTRLFVGYAERPDQTKRPGQTKERFERHATSTALRFEAG
jgi:hypothetical protein